VGLGNPGPEYAPTRHNVGWRVVAELARRGGGHLRAVAEQARVACVAVVGPDEEDREIPVALAQPTTYMNRSAHAVEALLAALGLELGDLLVVVDDFQLSVGRLRIRGKGSDGGHNGLASIIARMQTRVWARLRVGVGAPPVGVDPIDWVLGPFDPAEAPAVDRAIRRAADAAADWVAHGTAWCQNVYNAQEGADTEPARTPSGARDQEATRPAREQPTPDQDTQREDLS